MEVQLYFFFSGGKILGDDWLFYSVGKYFCGAFGRGELLTVFLLFHYAVNSKFS
jgi:hypothetical protein